MISGADKPIVRIENWSVVSRVVFAGYRSLEPGQRLVGDVFGHKSLSDGFILTSVILSIDPVTGLVETANTVYQLGKVNQDYGRWASMQEKADAA